MEFLSDHAAEIAAVFVAVVSMVNGLTVHWRELNGPTWQRFVLFVLEMLSVLTSRGKTTAAGPFKLPLTSATRNNDGGGLPPSVAAVVLASFMFVSCSTSGFTSVTRTVATSAASTARSLWDQYFPMAKAACESKLAVCTKDGVPVDACTQFVTCRDRVSDVALLVQYVYSTSEMLRKAIDEYTELQDGWQKQSARERVEAIAEALTSAMADLYRIINVPLQDRPVVADGGYAADGGVG